MGRFLSSTLLPLSFLASSLKPNCMKKGTLMIKGLLRNLEGVEFRELGFGFRVKLESS